MASTTARRVALMSIHPEYAEKLLSGSKRVEFRRAGPKERVDRLLVYATRPIGALVGILEIIESIRATPRQLWRDFGPVGGIEKKAFFTYFSGSATGSALVVGRVWRLGCAVGLEQAGLSDRAPQSFRYVEDALLAKLGALWSDPVGRPTRHCT
jgi:predicted transcriptional regulator